MFQTGLVCFWNPTKLKLINKNKAITLIKSHIVKSDIKVPDTINQFFKDKSGYSKYVAKSLES